MRHHAHSIRSDHTTGGRACLEIAGASKRAERGKSPDASRAPGSFHDGGEVEKTGVANDDAINLARRATSLLPPEKDAIVGNIILAGLAEIEARTGATSDALAILRQLLSVPAGGSVSIARLRIDPVWDPIRNDPGFQRLLAGKEQIGPNK